LRVLPPAIVEQVASSLDLRAQALVSKRIGSDLPAGEIMPQVPFTSVAITQIHLPIRFGGLGISSARITSPAAYLASAAAARAHLKGSNFAAQHYTDCWSRIGKLTPEFAKHLPRSDSCQITNDLADLLKLYEVPTKTPARVQHTLSTAMYQSILQILISASGDIHRSRLSAVTCRHAAAWLVCDLSHWFTRMTNQEFHQAIIHFLGLLPSSGIIACKCNQVAFVADHSHLHSCKRITRGRHTRHKLICKALQRVCLSAGFNVVEEQSVGLIPSEQGRIDLLVMGAGEHGAGSFFVDVTVVHPNAPTYRAPPGIRPGTLSQAVAVRQRLKHGKYDAAAIAEKSRVIPFVFESHGGLGPEGDKFLHLITESEAEHNRRSRHVPKLRFLSWARSVLSVAVQRGNAHVAIQGLQFIRHLRPGGQMGFVRYF
jgi:hypothetical protein